MGCSRLQGMRSLMRIRGAHNRSSMCAPSHTFRLHALVRRALAEDAVLLGMECARLESALQCVFHDAQGRALLLAPLVVFLDSRT